MKADTYCKDIRLTLGFISGGGHLGGGLQTSGVGFLSPGEFFWLCEPDLLGEFRNSLFSRSSQIWSVDGFLITMAGESFRSYPGRVAKGTPPPTDFFWHTGGGAGTTVILLMTGFCSGGGAECKGGGPLFTLSEGLGGSGTGMVGFFWMGYGGVLMGGWGTGGGGPLGW